MRLLTVPELAKALGISERGVYRLAESGRVPVVRVGRLLRFDEGRVLAALEEAPRAS